MKRVLIFVAVFLFSLIGAGIFGTINVSAATLSVYAPSGTVNPGGTIAFEVYWDCSTPCNITYSITGGTLVAPGGVTVSSAGGGTKNAKAGSGSSCTLTVKLTPQNGYPAITKTATKTITALPPTISSVSASSSVTYPGSINVSVSGTNMGTMSWRVIYNGSDTTISGSASGTKTSCSFNVPTSSFPTNYTSVTIRCATSSGGVWAERVSGAVTVKFPPPPTITGASLNMTSAYYGNTLSFGVTGTSISKVTYVVLYSTTTPGTTGSWSTSDPPGWNRFGAGVTVSSTSGISIGSMMDTTWKYVTVKAVAQNSAGEWSSSSYIAPACALTPAPPPNIMYEPIFKDNGGSSVSLLAYIQNGVNVSYKVFYSTALTPPEPYNYKPADNGDLSGWSIGTTGTLSNTGTNTWTGSASYPSTAKYAIFKVYAGSPGNEGMTWYTQIFKVSPGTPKFTGDWFKTYALTNVDGSLDFQSLSKMDVYINGVFTGYTYCGVEKLDIMNDGRNVVSVNQWDSIKQYFNNVTPATPGWIKYDGNTYYVYTLRQIVACIPTATINFDGYKREVYITMPIIPTITTTAATSISATVATGNGNVTSLGTGSIYQYGVIWSTTNDPTVSLSTKTQQGSKNTTGAFTSSITGLTPGTTYYYRAYATNVAGTAYGSVLTFKTNGPPTVTTGAVTSITTTSGIGNGTIVSLGTPNPTAYGVIWSTSPNPTTVLATKTNLGSRTTTGAFTSNMTGLTPGTTYYVRAYATNGNGSGYGNQVTFTTKGPPTVTTLPVTGIMGNSAIGNGDLVSLGSPNPTAYGVVWSSTNTMPTISLTTKTNLGIRTTTGNFTSNITGLIAGTTYYVRAYATNTSGTVYGSTVSFVAGALPTVTTGPVTNISTNGATFDGNITNLGTSSVLTYGFVWSTSPGPTVALTSKVNLGSTSGLAVFSVATAGSLSPNTTYYVRAYATNAIGTGYGNEISFKTGARPSISTIPVTNITTTTASSGGNVISLGNPNITEHGIVWSTSTNPTIALATKTQLGELSATGTFTSDMTGLTAGTTYYVRAYATNTMGTVYGNEISFITNSPPANYISNIQHNHVLFNGVEITGPNDSSVVTNGDYTKYRYYFTVSNSSTVLSLAINLNFDLGDGTDELSLTDVYSSIKIYRDGTLIRTFSPLERNAARKNANQYQIHIASPIDGNYYIEYKGKLKINTPGFISGNMINTGTITVINTSGVSIPQPLSVGDKNTIETKISKDYPTA